MPTALQVCNNYVESRWMRQEITKETRRSFRETLGLFVKFVGPETSLSKIDRAEVERWLGHLAKTCTEATVRLRLSTLKGMFQWAVIEGYAKRDPTVGIRGPKKPRSVPRCLSDEDADKVLLGAKDVRELLILTLMLDEGLRAGGVANLQLADIDLTANTLRVTEKGGHTRFLPLTEETRRVLERYIAEVRGRRSGPLLLTYKRSYAQSGDGLTARYVARMASVAVKRAGVDESGHALRHTCAYGMIRRGATMRDVQSALGHVSLSTTQIYTPFADVVRLEQVMGRKKHRSRPHPDEAA